MTKPYLLRLRELSPAVIRRFTRHPQHSDIHRPRDVFRVLYDPNRAEVVDNGILLES